MLIFDSHIFIWMLREPQRLSPAAYDDLKGRPDPILISMASVWEIEMKRASGKLDMGNFNWHLAQSDQFIEIIDMTLDDTIRAARLPMLHRDPFDRMIIAQALNRSAVVVTRDTVFRDYGVAVLEG
jgi:PIN domain nuclease of toxin-antitoxin system